MTREELSAIYQIERAAMMERKTQRERRPKLKATKLYRHWGAGGELLYVGISANVVARLAQHNNGSHWANNIARMTIETYPTREAAERAEREAIRTENPLHNNARYAEQPAKREREIDERFDLGELPIFKSKELTFANHGLKLTEKRVTHACIAKFNDEAPDEESKWHVRLSAMEYAATFHVSSDVAYDALQSVARTLGERRITFQDGTTARWVEKIAYRHGAGMLVLCFAPEIVPHIRPIFAVAYHPD
jgi:hypothetical protein